MKRIICLILSLILLLSLCACGSQNDPENADSNPVQRPADNDKPGTESTPNSAPTKPVFEPITIYDDPKYGTVQLDSVLNQVATFTVTNRSDSFMYFNIGEMVYVNDVLASPVELQKQNGFLPNVIHGLRFTYNVKVEQGQTETIYRIIPATSLNESTVDVSVKILYDNGEIGTYHKEIELVNKPFRIHTAETAVSDKYIATGNEPFAKETDAYKMFVTSCGEDQQSTQKKYWFLLYLENTTQENITFRVVHEVGKSSNVSSDQQDRVYYVSIAVNCFDKCVTLAPGKGFHMLVEIPKNDVDRFAKDPSEVITLNVPVAAYNGSDDGSTSTWEDTQVVQILRDTLVNGFNESKLTEAPDAPITAPGDPGDIGSGGVPDIPGAPKR